MTKLQPDRAECAPEVPRVMPGRSGEGKLLLCSHAGRGAHPLRKRGTRGLARSPAAMRLTMRHLLAAAAVVGTLGVGELARRGWLSR